MTATDAALKKYLGKGFDISNYDTFCDTEKAVLTDLLLPNKLFYDTSDEICRRGNDTQYSYTEYKKRMVKLEAMVSSSVAIEFGANWEKDVSWEQDFRYEVEAMFTTRVSFEQYLVDRIPTMLEHAENSKGDRIEGATDFSNRTLLHIVEPLKEANLLYNKLVKLHEESKDVTPGNRLTVCENLLKSERVAGATHFVSGVHLGAMIIKTSTTEKAETGEENAVSVNAEAGGVSASVRHAVQQGTKYRKSSKHIMVKTGPLVKLTDEGKLPPIIPKDQQVVIQLDLLPITALVTKEWRDTLKLACTARLNKKRMEIPATPGRDVEVPYLLKAGKFWLKVVTPRIVATKTLEEASRFYILSNSKTPDSFYIEHRDADGIYWYVFSDCKCNDDVKLLKVGGLNKSLFEVLFVHNCEKAKLSDWSNKKPVLIRRHESSVIAFKKYYLAVTAKDDLQLTCCGKPSTTEMETQFTIHNAPRYGTSKDED
jgi:hypothetical protein